MLRTIVSVLLLLVLRPISGAGQASPAGAYLDDGAARLLAGARSHSDTSFSVITAYEATARERVSVGLQAGRRDRLLARHEVVSRVTWTRGGLRRAQILGAREVLPVFRSEITPPADRRLLEGARARARPPGSSRVLSLPDDEDDSDAVIHPLAAGSEQHYRYRSGETTTIRLAAGRTVRLLELEVIPRQARSNLLSGSFWLDADTNAPVRGAFDLAAPLRVQPSAGLIPLPLPEGVFDIRYLTVEYGLWEGRWWMPRLMLFEGTASVGGISVPVAIEERFDDYRIYTDQQPWPGFEPVDTATFRTVETACTGAEGEDDEGHDDDDMDESVADGEDDCRPITIFVPRDSASLLRNEYLPHSIYAPDERLATGRELDELAGFVESAAWRRILTQRPSYRWTPIDGSLTRYNRVEGVTLGSSGRLDLAPLSASGTLWIGLAERRPSFEIVLTRDGVNGEESIGFYERLSAFAPRDRPFSLGNSISALIFGEDQGDYYRVLGARAKGERAFRGAALRLSGYLERQAGVEKHTDISVSDWWGGEPFRSNPAADEADQLGLEASVDVSWGLDPSRARVAATVEILAETGTYSFIRPGVAVYTVFPLPGRFLAALDVSTGASSGSLPAQRHWYLGGRGTVRGLKSDDRVAGEAFWAARVEIGTEQPAARIILFADAGWAGPREDWSVEAGAISAGVGLSVLDGLLRVDLAHVVRGGSGWSLQLSADAPL
ncbi:MAG: ShlB/FhaC/HecB family hemolysin secretion/activation protein [Gemmatimonadota bacterium]